MKRWIGGSGENVRHLAEEESHTLSKEMREIDEIGDCEISDPPVLTPSSKSKTYLGKG